MAAAVRELEVAINWRVTLLGLNLAAWLVLALIVAVLFMRRDLTPTLAPGLGYTIPKFEDLPAFYPVKPAAEPAVGLGRIAGLKPTGVDDKQRKLGLGQHQTAGLLQEGLGKPHRLAAPEEGR